VPISYYEMNNESGDKMQLNKLPGITRQDSVGSHTSSVTSEGSTKVSGEDSLVIFVSTYNIP